MTAEVKRKYWFELCRNAALARARFNHKDIDILTKPWNGDKPREVWTWGGYTERQWRYRQIACSILMGLYEVTDEGIQ